MASVGGQGRWPGADRAVRRKAVQLSSPHVHILDVDPQGGCETVFFGPLGQQKPAGPL